MYNYSVILSLRDSDNALYAPFFNAMGVTLAMVFTAAGSAYGILKAGSGLAMTSILHPELAFKAMVPIVMASIVSIYGLVVAVVISGKMSWSNKFTVEAGVSHLTAGLVCGLCGLGAGYAIGNVGADGLRALAYEQKIFIGLVLILIFSEVLGLYGMIMALLICK